MVDDDPDMKNLFVRLLTCENYIIKSARSIREALMLLDEFDLTKPITTIIDFVLYDEDKKTGGTGIDLVVELLQRNIKCNNILVSGSSKATEYIEMFKKQSQCEDNAALFPIQLVKPITGNELRTAVLKSINNVT